MSNFDDDFEIPDELTKEILDFLKGETENPVAEENPAPEARNIVNEAMNSLHDQIQLPRNLVLSILNYERDLIETLEEILAYLIADDAPELSASELALYDEVKHTIATRRIMNAMNAATVHGMRSV